MFEAKSLGMRLQNLETKQVYMIVLPTVYLCSKEPKVGSVGGQHSQSKNLINLCEYRTESREASFFQESSDTALTFWQSVSNSKQRTKLAVKISTRPLLIQI